LYLSPYEPRFVEGGPNSIFSFRRLKYWVSYDGSYKLESNSRNHVRRFLKTYANFNTFCVESIVRASRSQIERLEVIIHGIMAGIHLAGFRLRVSSIRRLIARIYRKVISDRFEVNYIGKEWKEFSNFLFVKASGLETLESPVLNSRNMFRSLYVQICSAYSSWGKSFPLDPLDKRSIEKLAQLCQTRFLPSAGAYGIKNSINKFISTTKSVFKIDRVTNQTIYSAASMVADYISRLNGSVWPYSAGHISLASSGDIDIPSAKGGRAAKIHEDVSTLLESVPTENKIMNLPFDLQLKDIAGVPRWRTWCRPNPVIAPPNAKFGEVVSSYGEGFILLDRRWGCDEALGSQIFAIALLKAKEWGIFNDEFELNPEFPPIPSRVIICPETGLKARTVTITKWWSIVLQQPLGHFLRETLSVHPFAKDGLTNDDQARQYISRLGNLRYSDDWSSYSLLSSDLAEATDAIPHETAYALLGPLLEKARLIGGLKYVPQHWEDYVVNPEEVASGSTPRTSSRLVPNKIEGSPFDNGYAKLALLIGCSPRQFTYGKLTWTSNRGIMMGEPLAKGILTLLNLAAEELAFYDYCVESGVPAMGGWSGVHKDIERFPIFVTSWRCAVVVGDDHAAYGPDSYLSKITENHKAWGSILSTDKHGRGSIVRLCEEVIIKPHKRMVSSAYPHASSYEESLVIDSIKLRLLVLCHRTRDPDQDSNPAIGKGIAMSEKLSYLTSPRRTREWKLTVVRVFVHNYWKKLPTGVNLHHMYLPKALGGLGLGVDLDDIRSHVEQSGYFTRSVLYVVSNQDKVGDTAIRKLKHMLTSLNSVQRASHGHSFPSILSDMITEMDWGPACEVLDIPAPRTVRIRDEPSYFSGRRIHNSVIKQSGFQCEKDVLKALARGAAFNEIFTKNAEIVSYRPAPILARMNAVLAFIDEQMCISDFDTASLQPLKSNPFELHVPENLDELIDRFTIDQEIALTFDGIPPMEVDAIQLDESIPFNEGDVMHFKQCRLEKTFYEMVEKGLPSLRLPRLMETTRTAPKTWGCYNHVRSLYAKTTWFKLVE